MIITRTPLRISLFGGGTDVYDFYRHYGGACLSFTINKYIYISVNEKFDGRTRVSYSETENVDNPCDLKHDLVRETLNFYNLRGVEITSVSDIPGGGSGLGSSSAFTVGLLAALSARMRNGTPYCRSMLAETAYTVEANLCGHPCGKQDQYAAAYGGFHYYGFNQDGTVQVQPISIQPEFTKNMMLFWTGLTRSANEILDNQRVRIKANKKDSIRAGIEMLNLVEYMTDQMERFDYCNFGKMLHLAWKTKKALNPMASNDDIDRLYAGALKAGAQGGKLCGAGGGGFLLLVVPEEKQQKVKDALKLRQVQFALEPEGSKVVYYGKTSLC